MTIVLRSYSVQDRAGLIRVIDEVCGEGRWMSTSRFEPTPAWESVLQQTQCDGHLLLLAVNDSAVAGWCRVFPESDAWQADASLGIGLLASYRKRGVGSGLVQQALAWAWSAGLQRVTLRTRLDNWQALHVFTRCGFKFLPGAEGIWTDMVCLRPALRLPQNRLRAIQPSLYPTSATSDIGSERVWL